MAADAIVICIVLSRMVTVTYTCMDEILSLWQEPNIKGVGVDLTSKLITAVLPRG